MTSLAPALLASHPLRPYQARAIAEARQRFREGKRAILLVAPTGAGKTRIGAELVTSAIRKGGRVLWLAHREELLKQARERLLGEGVERVGIIAPWASRDPDAPVQVASVQTLLAMLRKDKALPKATIAVFDEAHHYAAEEWLGVAANYAGAPVLGLTATPERGDGRPMGDLFDCIVPVSSVAELTELGVLVPVLTFAPETRTKDLSAHPHEAYAQRCPGERAFVFCATVAHAERVAAEFRASGVPAATIHADTPRQLRQARLEAFRRQNVKPLREAGSIEDAPLALVNVYALTEGVDVPEASAVILARGCDHSGTFIQMVGRGARCAPGKTRMVLIDLRGVVHKHGLFEADREYSLDGKAIKEAEAEPSPCSCKHCGCVFRAWAVNRDTGQRWCPNCNEPTTDVSPVGTVSKRDLREMGSAARPEVKRAELARLVDVCVRKDFKPGWVAHQYKLAFGHWPQNGAVKKLIEARGE